MIAGLKKSGWLKFKFMVKIQRAKGEYKSGEKI